MLRMSVSTEEYLMIGDNIKIVFLGGTGNHIRIMVDAPKEVNIVRSTVLEKNLDSRERDKMPRYYAEPERPEKYRRRNIRTGCAASADSKRNIDSSKGRQRGEAE